MKYERAGRARVALDVDRGGREHVPGFGTRSLDPLRAPFLRALPDLGVATCLAFAVMPTAGFVGHRPDRVLGEAA